MLLIFALCLIGFVSASPTKDTFIVNGEDAVTFVPHHVHLRISSSVNPTVIFAGSGSLISSTVIVTVAQNVFRFNTFSAGVGHIQFSLLQWREINGRLVHPDYSEAVTNRLENNIALLRLAAEMNVVGVVPLNLINIPAAPAPPTAGSISGFGIRDQTGTITISENLQIGTTSVITNEDCIATYNFLTSGASHFCATSADATNFCGGDQGAAFHSGNILLGIASTVFDAASCGANTPALYERASFYFDWLSSNMANTGGFENLPITAIDN